MTQTERDNRRDAGTAALSLLIVITAFVAAITFVLSFVGLDDYGSRVAGEGPLSFLVPLGVDGLTMVGVVATYALRTAPWHMRAYAWLVFSIALGSSIAGNLSHALAHHLSAQGQAGAVVWPVFFAASSHVVIIVRRWQERRRETITDRPAETAPAEAPKHAETATEKRPASKPMPAEQYARQQAGRGWSVSKIHQALVERGDTVSRSTVGRWVKEAKAASETAETGEPAEPVDDIQAEIDDLIDSAEVPS